MSVKIVDIHPVIQVTIMSILKSSILIHLYSIVTTIVDNSNSIWIRRNRWTHPRSVPCFETKNDNNRRVSVFFSSCDMWNVSLFFCNNNPNDLIFAPSMIVCICAYLERSIASDISAEDESICIDRFLSCSSSFRSRRTPKVSTLVFSQHEMISSRLVSLN